MSVVLSYVVVISALWMVSMKDTMRRLGNFALFIVIILYWVMVNLMLWLSIRYFGSLVG